MLPFRSSKIQRQKGPHVAPTSQVNVKRNHAAIGTFHVRKAALCRMHSPQTAQITKHTWRPPTPSNPSATQQMHTNASMDAHATIKTHIFCTFPHCFPQTKLLDLVQSQILANHSFVVYPIGFPEPIRLQDIAGASGPAGLTLNFPWKRFWTRLAVSESVW